MSELKPCPFCGGEAQLYTWHKSWVSHGCNVIGSYIYVCEYDTEAEAIAAWNSRAERTCKPIIEPWDDQTKYDAYCGNCNYPLGDGELEPWNYYPQCGKAVKR